MRRLRWIILTLVLSAGLAAAQEFSTATPINANGRPTERWDPSGRGPVAGELIAGVVAGVQPAAPPSPTASLPGERYACLGLISKDGAYSSETQYAIDGEGTKTIFIYSTEFPEAFRTNVAYAARVTPGECGERKHQYSVVAFGPDLYAADAPVRVLVNSLGADSVSLAFHAANAPIKVDCIRLFGGRTTGFDFECTLDPAAAQHASGFVLQRFQGVTALQAHVFKIVGWP